MSSRNMMKNVLTQRHLHTTPDVGKSSVKEKITCLKPGSATGPMTQQKLDNNNMKRNVC